MSKLEPKRFQLLKFLACNDLLGSPAQASQSHKKGTSGTKKHINFLFASADVWPSKASWHLSSVGTGALCVDCRGSVDTGRV